MKYLQIILLLSAVLFSGCSVRYAQQTTGHDVYNFVEARKESEGTYTVYLSNKWSLLTVWHYKTHIIREPKWSKQYFYNGKTIERR